MTVVVRASLDDLLVVLEQSPAGGGPTGMSAS